MRRWAGSGPVRSAITVPAAVLAALTVFPMTAWVAAVLIPVWLGIAAVDPRR